MQKFYSLIVYKNFHKIFTRTATEREETTANGQYYEQQAITDRDVSL